MRTETTDICVIGSGPGGAVIAHEAALRGRQVLIVERGPYARGVDMTHDEVNQIALLYKDAGLQLNTSMDMFIIQGSCVGGSSVLANNVMFRAPDRTLDEWERQGARVDRAALHRSYDKIERTLGAGPPIMDNVENGSRLLLGGAKSLGMNGQWMHKALGKCSGCGGCNIGCVFDLKPSMATTYVPWAEAKGARVLPSTTVQKIEHKRGKVTGVLCTDTDGHELRIQAKVVIVAGGAIGSSAILLKSKITKNVGTRLSFNAGTACLIEYPDTVDPFDGDQMTAYVEGDGFMIEPVGHPPASTALMVPGWFGLHHELMKKYRKLHLIGALVATEPVGRVVHSPFFGHEETRFHLPDGDLKKLKRGLRAVAQIAFAAGATRVILPTHVPTILDCVEQLDRVDTAFMRIGEIAFGSSHPQGGNPMSEDPSVGVVDRDFAVHGFENLYVCDASVFTSCIGVNPINTIAALADYAAPRVLARS